MRGDPTPQTTKKVIFPQPETLLTTVPPSAAEGGKRIANFCPFSNKKYAKKTFPPPLVPTPEGPKTTSP